jgi:hypothetical protein
MDHRRAAAQTVAARLLAGPAWSKDAVANLLRTTLGRKGGAARAILVKHVLALGQAPYLPSQSELAGFLYHSEVFKPPADRRLATCLDPPRFAPALPLRDLKLPALAAIGDMSDWLGLPAEQLDWLADMRRTHERTLQVPLQHYRYAFVDKRAGGLRLLEAPKPRLKAIQRRILHEILSRVPVHDCAKGFVAGRSCLNGAQVHAGETVVATFDLAQFFPSLGHARVHGLFRTLGYPKDVARRLTGLCTTITPRDVYLRLPPSDRPADPIRPLFGLPHLPQGAPTSPALANLLAFRLDIRLHGLARAAGANYTRYADDLAFSGGYSFARRLDGFQEAVGCIALEEGFALNPTKTRIMPRSARQRVTGVVVNAHCNVARPDFDELKATLHNCVRDGVASQNRAGLPDFRRHLDGRVVWVEQVNPSRGNKLRRLFEAIDWNPTALSRHSSIG